MINSLVSIVTPSYNSARYLRETIESILGQDYPAIEHIVIDGGSTDGTLEILKSYPNLKWISEPDRGQSQAINKGFRMARGEIIGWLNADDLYRPGAVSTAIEFLTEHQDVDVVYGDLQVIDEANRPIRITRSQPFDIRSLILVNYIKQPTVFMRRCVIEDLGGVDEHLHYVMDWEFWVRAGLKYKMGYLQDQVLANFRLCPGTKSFENPRNFTAEWLQVIENLPTNTNSEALPKAAWKEALARAMNQYDLALFFEAADRHDRYQLLKGLPRLISGDKTMLISRKVWRSFAQGLFGTN